MDEALSGRLARAARASQELCEVLWEELQEELRAPRPARVHELSERLAAVAATVSALAREPAPRAGEPASEPPIHPEPPIGPAAPAAPVRSTALLVDERAIEIRDAR